MVPNELHGRISFEDEMNLSKVYTAVRSFRRIGPILRTIINCKWDNMRIIKPHLMATLETRSDARQMKASNDWRAFWSDL